MLFYTDSSITIAKQILFILAIMLCFTPINAQVSVGSGSYSANHPGADEAGRNNVPSGSPQLSGNAVGKPVPTNDWWSSLVKENHASNLFNYPLTLSTLNNGLIMTYIPWGVIGDNAPIEIGLIGLNTSRVTVSDYSDWTMTMNWNDGARDMKATSGIGMPFVYFEKNAGTTVSVKVNNGTASISNELLIIQNASYDADFVIYAPAGSIWTNSGNTYTSTLNGKNYWSAVMLPQNTANVQGKATELKKYAYVFPTNTTTTWNYDQTTAKVVTDFNVTTAIKEGTNTNVLMGLLPHQWSNLDPTSATPAETSYGSVRGELKMLDGNSFKVSHLFKGILPTLPNVTNYSTGFDPTKLDAKIGAIENEGLSTWTDSYNDGQVLNRLIQTARIADQTGDTEARNKMVATIKERVEDWLSYQQGEVAFLFYYNTTWDALIGYPAGHGQDSNLNDHHFHWGYFVHAAAFLEQVEPGWADQWGPMVNLLIRDAASTDRNDAMFPFLRNFSPYAGHSWANGFATFPNGNDQESTSESMQFASSLIHWGTITENDTIRDLGIYIYTTEQSAVEEYWFDMYDRNFQPSQQYRLVSRIWGNSYDNGVFWTGFEMAPSYGIELYPIHAGSLYLGHNKAYAENLWAEMATNTGILSNQENDNLWHDTYWKFLSLTDAQAAIDLYDSYPDRTLKFGISDPQTYHWLHAMNALGPVDPSITANYPIAAAFTDNTNYTTYVAHNYSNTPITVNFSDGFNLDVPAGEMVTSRDVEVDGELTVDFNQAYAGGSVNLALAVTGNGVTKVEFFDGSTLIATDTTAPYETQVTDLALGVHGMYAKVFVEQGFNNSNSVTVQVGEQIPYAEINVIPGIIEAGLYDKYEGGLGQNIAYVDNSQSNAGDARLDEYVDAAVVTNEGTTVGWNNAGEWLEYTVDVQTSGNYTLQIRYASGNSSGGGPIYFEIDGEPITNQISFAGTQDWSNWATKTVSNVPLQKGVQVLRLVVVNGEYNIGKMTFSYASPLGFDPPMADAGANVSTTIASSNVTLDGSGSYAPTGQTTSYNWTQVYGPTALNFSSTSVASPTASNLVEGVYKCELTVSTNDHSSKDEVLIIVSQSGNATPSIFITAPNDGSSFTTDDTITITAAASDLDGTITKVEFYQGNTKIGEDTASPFSSVWTDLSAGSYSLTAKATDNGGATKVSPAVQVDVSEVTSCTITDNQASQGSFSVGYRTTFETVGSSVTISITLLDTDKQGPQAHLWKQTPFQESQMNHVEGNTFSATVGGLTAGETISYAVKFAYAGGLSATKYMSYVVGNNCNSGGEDTDAPTNFTASIGAVSARSVELLLQADEDSTSVVYTVVYGQEEVTKTGTPGQQTALVINGLSAETTYSFSVSAADISGNTAANNPISLSATTTANTNTECFGTASDAQQGSFSTGYSYSFETVGSSVTITFELLDTDKTGVNAYLWKQVPFVETTMSNVSGNKFSTTVNGLTAGQTISYACKFAFAGGLAATKYFSYTVGEDCTLSTNLIDSIPAVIFYPNPATNMLSSNALQAKVDKMELYSITGKKLMELNKGLEQIRVDGLTSGLYLIKVYQREKQSFYRIVIE